MIAPRVFLILALVALANLRLVRAQGWVPDATRPAFEVASVKVNRSDDQNSRVSGQPSGRDRFDIVAKAAGDPPLERLQLMLQTLLAERFKLAVHTEAREQPIYTLLVARSDGRIGPQLRRSDVDCAALVNACRFSKPRDPFVTTFSKPFPPVD